MHSKSHSILARRKKGSENMITHIIIEIWTVFIVADFVINCLLQVNIDPRVTLTNFKQFALIFMRSHTRCVTTFLLPFFITVHLFPFIHFEKLIDIFFNCAFQLRGLKMWVALWNSLKQFN